MKALWDRITTYCTVRGSRAISDLLPTQKGEGSLGVDHRFVVYHLHSHYFIASGGVPPPRSIRPVVDRWHGLVPITPIPRWKLPSFSTSLGLGDMYFPLTGTLIVLFIPSYQRLKILPRLKETRLVSLLSTRDSCPLTSNAWFQLYHFLIALSRSCVTVDV